MCNNLILEKINTRAMWGRRFFDLCKSLEAIAIFFQAQQL